MGLLSLEIHPSNRQLDLNLALENVIQCEQCLYKESVGPRRMQEEDHLKTEGRLPSIGYRESL